MKIALAILMIVHGIAHAPGFLVPWRIASPSGAVSHTFDTSLLAGTLEVGIAAIRAMGVFWLIVGLAFVITGIGALLGGTWWIEAAVAVTILSLVLSILGYPDARIGIAVNLVLLVALYFAATRAW